jgi:hypothetical protein
MRHSNSLDGYRLHPESSSATPAMMSVFIGACPSKWDCCWSSNELSESLPVRTVALVQIEHEDGVLRSLRSSQPLH